MFFRQKENDTSRSETEICLEKERALEKIMNQMKSFIFWFLFDLTANNLFKIVAPIY